MLYNIRMTKNILQKILTFVFILFLSACSEAGGGNVKINDSSAEEVPITTEAPTALERANLTSDELLRIAISSLITISADGSQSIPLSMTQASVSSSTLINIVGCVQVGELYYDFTGSTTGAVSSIEFDTFTETTSCEAETVTIDDTIEEDISITGTVGGSCGFRQFSTGFSIDCNEYQDDSTLGSYAGVYNIFTLTETAYSIASSGTFSYEDTFGVSSLEVFLKGTFTLAEDDIACYQASSLSSLAEDFSSDTCDGESTFNYNQVVEILSEYEVSDQQLFCILSYGLCVNSSSTCFSAADTQDALAICAGSEEEDSTPYEIERLRDNEDNEMANSYDSFITLDSTAESSEAAFSIDVPTESEISADVSADNIRVTITFHPNLDGFDDGFPIGISNATGFLQNSFQDQIGLIITLSQLSVLDYLDDQGISSGSVEGYISILIENTSTFEVIGQSEELWKLSFQIQ